MNDTTQPSGESTETIHAPGESTESGGAGRSAEESTAESSITAGSTGEQPTTEAADSADSTRSVPVASLLPWRSGHRDADLTITVYIVTGKHGKLRIPERFCRECNLFVRAADMAAAQVAADVDVRVVSWWTHILSALRYGGYHAPVMVVGRKRLCQGYDVPTTDEVVDAIEAELE